MLRNNSTQALAKRLKTGLLGKVRKVPIKVPTSMATTQALKATDSVQPQALSNHSR